VSQYEQYVRIVCGPNCTIPTYQNNFINQLNTEESLLNILITTTHTFIRDGKTITGSLLNLFGTRFSLYDLYDISRIINIRNILLLNDFKSIAKRIFIECEHRSEHEFEAVVRQVVKENQQKQQNQNYQKN
jgi:hypothetical protein